MLVRGLSIEEIARFLGRDHREVQDKVVEMGRVCRGPTPVNSEWWTTIHIGYRAALLASWAPACISLSRSVETGVGLFIISTIFGR